MLKQKDVLHSYDPENPTSSGKYLRELQVELRPTSSLKLHGRNPRTHSPRSPSEKHHRLS